MTLQISQPADKNLQAELDRLTYSAYLLTLDPGVAFSVVMRAIDGSIEHPTPDLDLFERTVHLSLQQLPCESITRWDGESPPVNPVPYAPSPYPHPPPSRSPHHPNPNPT